MTMTQAGTWRSKRSGSWKGLVVATSIKIPWAGKMTTGVGKLRRGRSQAGRAVGVLSRNAGRCSELDLLSGNAVHTGSGVVAHATRKEAADAGSTTVGSGSRGQASGHDEERRPCELIQRSQSLSAPLALLLDTRCPV